MANYTVVQFILGMSLKIEIKALPHPKGEI